LARGARLAERDCELVLTKREATGEKKRKEEKKEGKEREADRSLNRNILFTFLTSFHEKRRGRGGIKGGDRSCEDDYRCHRRD